MKKRTEVEIKRAKGILEKLLVYSGDDIIKGNVIISFGQAKKLEHKGIKIELIGQIELFYDRGNHYQFTSLSIELAPSGEMTEPKTFNFEFLNVEKQYESYNGINVKLRYFLRVTVQRSLVNVTKEQEFWIQCFHPDPELNTTIKMEVGIEDCLHIEFEYNKSKYHLKDVIIGKIYFLLVRLKIKYMELALIRRESTGTAPNSYNETETLTKFEIMDGAPVRGESIPVRLFLGGFDLTPTYRSVHNRFSVKYFLNLVLIDEEDRRYFKQQEVFFWRKAKSKKSAMELEQKHLVQLTLQPNKEIPKETEDNLE